jgi:hypothetical protein
MKRARAEAWAGARDAAATIWRGLALAADAAVHFAFLGLASLLLTCACGLVAVDDWLRQGGARVAGERVAKGIIPVRLEKEASSARENVTF